MPNLKLSVVITAFSVDENNKPFQVNKVLEINAEPKAIVQNLRVHCARLAQNGIYGNDDKSTEAEVRLASIGNYIPPFQIRRMKVFVANVDCPLKCERCNVSSECPYNKNESENGD